MNYEQDNSLTYYRLGAIFLGAAIVVVTIGGSLGLVWMRQQAYSMAGNTAQLQSKIAEAERFSSGLEVRIARALTPQSLSARLPQGLRPTVREQIVWSAPPRALSPVEGFENGTMVAALVPQAAPVRAGSAVAAQTAPISAQSRQPVRQQAQQAQQVQVAQQTRQAQAGSSLVTTPAGSTPAVAAQSGSTTVTFDLALLGAQTQQGASVRR